MNENLILNDESSNFDRHFPLFYKYSNRQGILKFTGDQPDLKNFMKMKDKDAAFPQNVLKFMGPPKKGEIESICWN